jgi:SAM-dependent methyltransferase
MENGFEGRLCSCGTVYSVPPPPEGAIDITRDGHARLFYARYASMKARWVHRLRPSGRLLEIGCGEGDFLTAAKSLGYEVYGVEADSGRARRASEWLRRPVRCATLDELWPPAKGFDVIYHCDLLSHFPDPVQALRRMCELLSRNGMLAFEVGTLGDIPRFWYEWIGNLGFPDHRWLYSERSLRRLMWKARLRIVRMQHFGLAPAVAFHRSARAAASAVNTVRNNPLWALIERRYGRKGQTVGAVREAQAGHRVANTYDRASRNRTPNGLENINQFLRYRIGQFSPRFGPATWLIAAKPELEISL